MEKTVKPGNRNTVPSQFWGGVETMRIAVSGFSPRKPHLRHERKEIVH